MELKSQIYGIDISNYSKPSKIVCTLVNQLLNQDYTVSLDVYYNNPEHFSLLN
jgi:hypothetical protein